MSVQQFFRILWARRAITVTSLIACLIGALLVIQLVPSRYEASSRLILDIVRPDPVSGEALSSSFARAYVKTQTELIKDYRVAGRVVDAFGWTGSPELTAQYRASGSDLPLHRWLAQRVIDRTDAKLIDASNIMEITYTGEQPETTARIADQLRQAYSDQTMLFKQQAARRNADWFKQQTEKLKKQVADAEASKAAFEQANNIVLQDNDTDAESARLAALASTAPPPPAMTAPIAAPVASPSQTQLAQIDATIATASQTLGPNHPDLIAMRQQRAVVAANASREMAAARAAAGSGGRMTGPSIGAMFNAQQQKVLAQRGKVAEARQLMVNVRVAREELERTATRASQLDQQAESDETGLTFLGSAVAPQTPSFPKKIPLLAGAIALGLAFGVLTSLIIALLFRRVRAIDDIYIEGVPVLGMMAGSLPAPKGKLTRLLTKSGSG